MIQIVPETHQQLFFSRKSILSYGESYIEDERVNKWIKVETLYLNPYLFPADAPRRAILYCQHVINSLSVFALWNQ